MYKKPVFKQYLLPILEIFSESNKYIKVFNKDNQCYFDNGTYPTCSTIFCPSADKQKSINGFTVFSTVVK